MGDACSRGAMYAHANFTTLSFGANLVATQSVKFTYSDAKEWKKYRIYLSTFGFGRYIYRKTSCHPTLLSSLVHHHQASQSLPQSFNSEPHHTQLITYRASIMTVYNYDDDVPAPYSSREHVRYGRLSTMDTSPTYTSCPVRGSLIPCSSTVHRVHELHYFKKGKHDKVGDGDDTTLKSSLNITYDSGCTLASNLTTLRLICRDINDAAQEHSLSYDIDAKSDDARDIYNFCVREIYAEKNRCTHALHMKMRTNQLMHETSTARRVYGQIKLRLKMCKVQLLAQRDRGALMDLWSDICDARFTYKQEVAADWVY